MDTKAAWYDTFYSQKKILPTYAWYQGLLSIIADKKIPISNSRLLEIGSGAGEFLNALPVQHGIGIDISDAALRHATKNATTCDFLKSRAEALPFPDNAFDIVICCEVIEHVDDPNRTLREIHRVLKKEGTLFFSFPNYINPQYLFVRLMATLFRQPQWISLQIVDRYFFYFGLVAKIKAAGFSLIHAKGTCYSHQKVPLLKLLNKGESIFDRLGLQFLSFHPVLCLKKNSD